MKVIPTELPGVVVLEPVVHADARGFFYESYRKDVFARAGLNAELVQDNHSRSVRGTLRGLHFQTEPHAQVKLCRVTQGEVFDVVVDVRPGSATFGKWVSQILSAENKTMIWIPAGFAHGFYVTSETAEFVYKCSDYYAPECERGVRWDDPEIGVRWPIAAGITPIVSAKDQRLPPLRSLRG
ncbi:MAG TPA: dTDP-4-dehydrorhamnose 3,5-epimerase [bacterium]|nr:dTDP-4-dehydrorhamnose 3,5-epimerase [bacterium]